MTTLEPGTTRVPDVAPKDGLVSVEISCRGSKPLRMSRDGEPPVTFPCKAPGGRVSTIGDDSTPALTITVPKGTRAAYAVVRDDSGTPADPSTTPEATPAVLEGEGEKDSYLGLTAPTRRAEVSVTCSGGGTLRLEPLADYGDRTVGDPQRIACDSTGHEVVLETTTPFDALGVSATAQVGPYILAAVARPAH